MTNKTLKIVLAVSLLLNIVVFAAAGFVYGRHAGWWGEARHRDRGDRIERLAADLSLTPGQISSIKALDAGFRAEMKEKRAAVLSKRGELIELLRHEEAGSGEVEAVLDELAALQIGLQRTAVGHILEEKALLDPAQAEKFMDKIEKKMKKKRRGHGPD